MPRLLWFLADEVWIVPNCTNPRVRPRPDRIAGLAVLGTAPAADQMPCHLRHRHALGEAQDFGIEVEMPLRPAIAAVDLKQLSLSDEIPDRHRPEP